MWVLVQVRFVLTTIEEYSYMKKVIIEGLEPITNKFQHVFQTIHNKTSDVLDHRNSDFDYDYEDFSRHVNDLQVCYYLCLLSLLLLLLATTTATSTRYYYCYFYLLLLLLFLLAYYYCLQLYTTTATFICLLLLIRAL